MIRRTPSAPAPATRSISPVRISHHASLPDAVLPVGGDFRGDEGREELSEPGQRERCRLGRRGGPQLPAAGKMLAQSRREAQDLPGCSPGGEGEGERAPASSCTAAGRCKYARGDARDPFGRNPHRPRPRRSDDEAERRGCDLPEPGEGRRLEALDGGDEERRRRRSREGAVTQMVSPRVSSKSARWAARPLARTLRGASLAKRIDEDIAWDLVRRLRPAALGGGESCRVRHEAFPDIGLHVDPSGSWNVVGTLTKGRKWRPCAICPASAVASPGGGADRPEPGRPDRDGERRLPLRHGAGGHPPSPPAPRARRCRAGWGRNGRLR